MGIIIPFFPYKIQEEAELWNIDFDAVSKLLFLLFPEIIREPYIWKYHML